MEFKIKLYDSILLTMYPVMKKCKLSIFTNSHLPPSPTPQSRRTRLHVYSNPGHLWLSNRRYSKLIQNDMHPMHKESYFNRILVNIHTIPPYPNGNQVTFCHQLDFSCFSNLSLVIDVRQCVI